MAHKKIFACIFGALLLSTVQTKTDFKNNPLSGGYPYLVFNIEQLIKFIRETSSLMRLHSKYYFDDAPTHEITEIKNIAKKLGFSQRAIKKLRVKVPKDYNHFDNMFRNNYAAFLNTVILGRQDHCELSKIIARPEVKRFIYAHELSHIKYKHMSQKIFSFIAIAIASHLGIELLSFCYKIKNNPITTQIKAFAKILLQLPIFIAVQRKFEKQADLGAASLGSETTEGGILYFKALIEAREKMEQEVLQQCDSILSKALFACILFIKRVYIRLIDSHPSHEKRIQYLQAILKKQEPTT